MLEALQAVRERTQDLISVRLPDASALALALACGSAEAEDLVGYGFEGAVRADALAALPKLALSDSEFGAIFGTAEPSRPAPYATMPCRRLKALAEGEDAHRLRFRQEVSLTCTLQEPAQRAAWERLPAVRLAALVALLRASDSEACVNFVTGGLVAADARRVDDHKADLEDAGLDIVFVSEVMTALAEAATGSG
jgi:hypothetical protein